MTRLPLALALAATVAFAPSAAAQLPVGGVASDNVEFVKNLAQHADTAGGILVDGYYYVTTTRDLNIYDVKDPENPVLAGSAVYPLPGQPQFSEEDPTTNGKILAVSNIDFFVYDVSDKSSPTLLATIPGLDEHTMQCVLDCTWVYGSEGSVIDLRDPKAPKRVGDWREVIGQSGSTHDVTEVSPGILVTSTEPFFVLDVTADPTKPVVLAEGKTPGFMHANLWPHQGKDDFLLAGGESTGPGCAEDTSATFMTYNATSWATSKTFSLIDEFRMSNGTLSDGKMLDSSFCVHWFDPHPTYANGGLVAIAWYEHGTRFLQIDAAGKISEIGYLLTYGGQASDADWITDRVVYVADYLRGIDIVKFTGTIPPGFPKTAPVGTTPAGGAATSPPAPPGPSFDQLVTLPSSKRCARAKTFRIRARTHKTDPVTSLTLRVNGRKVASAKGSRLKQGLRVKRLPRKRFSVIVEVRTRTGHKTAAQRTYRTCSK